MNMDKTKQLKQSKKLATGLFLFMALVYILMVYLLSHYPQNWMGYVKAFSEAAMVGALADWFAVTALFHHPLGLPIPHTNIIEKSKQKIGNNLGDFVVENFLSSNNLRPYIQKIKVTKYVIQFLEKEKNQEFILKEIRHLLIDIVEKLNDEAMATFIARKSASLIDTIQFNDILASGVTYFLNKKEHEPLITFLAQKIKFFIHENEEMVRDRVKEESYFFIPKFVDKKLAAKIASGLIHYFEEIEQDPQHKIRTEISTQLYKLADDIRIKPYWQNEVEKLKSNLLSEKRLMTYANSIWENLKGSIRDELNKDPSSLINYLGGMLQDMVMKMNEDPVLEEKIDHWVRHHAYKLILRNTNNVSLLISNTVGKWEGRELSEKLELEVGKDLQFIRINGTIVGGIVGLLIYTITKLF